jgi:hypothetical protein
LRQSAKLDGDRLDVVRDAQHLHLAKRAGEALEANARSF